MIVPRADRGRRSRPELDNRPIYGSPAWTEDGSEPIFSSARAGLQGLWRMPFWRRSGPERKLENRCLLFRRMQPRSIGGLHARHKQPQVWQWR